MSTLTPDQLQSIRDLISKKAAKLRSHSLMRGVALQDLEQELWLGALKRAQRYDEERGAFEDFINIVLENIARNLIRHASASKRGPGRCPLDLDAVGLSSLEKDYRLDAQNYSEVERTEMRIDVNEAEAALPESHSEIVHALRESTPSQVAKRLGLSTATLYRRLKEVEAHGSWRDLKKYIRDDES